MNLLLNLKSDPALDPWRNGNTDTYLMNLGFLGDLEKREKFTEKIVGPPKSKYSDPFFTGFQNLAQDPALDPWRNGNTDTYLMNLA